MGGQYDTTEINKLVDVVAEGGNVAELIANEQGDTAAKLGHLMKVTDELFALTSLNIDKLKKQAGELDAEDRQKMLDRFGAKFNLENDRVEALFESGLALGNKAFDLVKEIIAFAQDMKTAKK